MDSHGCDTEQAGVVVRNQICGYPTDPPFEAMTSQVWSTKIREKRFAAIRRQRQVEVIEVPNEREIVKLGVQLNVHQSSRCPML